MTGVATLVYDGDGHRVAKTAAGKTTTYLIDDLNPTGYAQVVEEIVNGAPQRTYTYGSQRISQNQVVNGTWTASFYGYDGFGNVRQLMDKTGAVTDSYEYDAWGNTINSAGTTPNNYLYRGEQYDSDLGFYYLRARYFNPLTGRFLSRDSQEGSTRTPASLHRYMYANGDPVNGRDPSGHQGLIEYVETLPESTATAGVEVAEDEIFAELESGLGEGGAPPAEPPIEPPTPEPPPEPTPEPAPRPPGHCVSNCNFGNQMHAKFDNYLESEVGTDSPDLNFNTKPGQTGPDAEWTNENEPSPLPDGVDIAELKPDNARAIARAIAQVQRWGQGPCALYVYDQAGNIFFWGIIW
jgi:RHS repeat-associated protein